jgi:hypothetical protein
MDPPAPTSATIASSISDLMNGGSSNAFVGTVAEIAKRPCNITAIGIIAEAGNSGVVDMGAASLGATSRRASVELAPLSEPVAAAIYTSAAAPFAPVTSMLTPLLTVPVLLP